VTWSALHQRNRRYFSGASFQPVRRANARLCNPSSVHGGRHPALAAHCRRIQYSGFSMKNHGTISSPHPPTGKSAKTTFGERGLAKPNPHTSGRVLPKPDEWPSGPDLLKRPSRNMGTEAALDGAPVTTDRHGPRNSDRASLLHQRDSVPADAALNRPHRSSKLRREKA